MTIRYNNHRGAFTEATLPVKMHYNYLLEDKVGVTTTNTLNGGDGEHDVPLTINIGVHNTQNVLERWGNYQRHSGSLQK